MGGCSLTSLLLKIPIGDVQVRHSCGYSSQNLGSPALPSVKSNHFKDEGNSKTADLRLSELAPLN